METYLGKPLAIFGDPVDEKALGQLKTCLSDDRAIAGALMADHHLGYSMPIGGVIAYEGAISPSGVGFDIACGNKAVRTDMHLDDLGPIIPLVERIQKEVAFGIGRVAEIQVDHELFERDVWDEIDVEPGQPLKQKAAKQLGTVGSGNHYVDLLVDENLAVWVVVHFGSRGLGHTIASRFMALAYGLPWGERFRERDEPAVLNIGTPAGDLYVEAMQLAGEYAYAGRDAVVNQVLDIIGSPDVLKTVHCHHNYAWLEAGCWIVRKGATPLYQGVPAFIGGSMGDMSAIVRGTGQIAGDLGSAPHGAGRVMSRTKAAGKFIKVKEERTRPDGSTYTFKRRVRDASTGAVDWLAVRQDLADRGIVVRGSGADEAPEVYKDLATVLGQHENIVIEDVLWPVGVVMAGIDEFDPYKD